MKKNVLVIAGLAVLSTSAFASKARMEALGQDSRLGSLYISDSRDVFRNAASLNDMKNYLVTEWGTGAVADSTTAPRAEGGFFREMGSFAYGLYLGNGPANARTINSGAGTQFQDHQNPLDLFLAGDMGVKWGARIHYANSSDETQPAGAPFTRKNSAFGLGLGVESGDLEGYVNLDITDKSSGATVAGDEWKNKLGGNIGASYKWSGVTFFADYAMAKATVTAATGSTIGSVTVNGTAVNIATGTAMDIKSNTITVGAGRIHEINPTARLITDAQLVFGTSEIAGSSTTVSNGKTKSTLLPVTLGFEADATSWLVLRGNIHQNVILGSIKNTSGQKQTVANSTGVDAGASLNFGKLKVDGSIGTTTAANGTGTHTNSGVLSTSNLLTRVGVSYWF